MPTQVHFPCPLHWMHSASCHRKERVGPSTLCNPCRLAIPSPLPLFFRYRRQAEVVVLAESLLELMDGDRDDAVSFPDFLRVGLGWGGLGPAHAVLGREAAECR